MKMMNFCKLLIAVLLFLFTTFELFFGHSFTKFYHFFLPKNKIKNGTLHVDYDSKLKWKFDICDSWLVTFLVREPCQRPPCTTVHNHGLSGIMPTVNIILSLKPRSTTTFNEIPKPHFAKCRQTIGTMWKLTAKEVRFEWSHWPQAGFIYRDQAQDLIIYYCKWIERVETKSPVLMITLDKCR